MVWTSLLVLTLQATVARPQDEPLGKTAAFGNLDAGPSVTVPAGTALRSRPDPGSARLVTIETESDLQVLERRGDWVRTAYRDWTGWLAPLGEEESELPIPTDLRASQMTWDTSIVEQAEKIESALALFDSVNPDFASVGPWKLYTDVVDAELLELLDHVAGQVPAVYARRFGLTRFASTEPPPIVLFAREEDYRSFANAHSDVGDLNGGGHADRALAALFVPESTSPKAVAATLVHELTHLLNREHFTVAPFTWLEEGMANELGFTLIDAKGNLQIGRLGGETWLMRQRTPRGTLINASQSGGQAAWTLLAQDWRQRRPKLMPIDRLLDLPWKEFVEGGQRSSNYSLAVFLLRYLLDDAGDEVGAAFRGFIRGAARGEASDSAALASALGTTPEHLRRDFERWLTVEVVSGR